MSDKEKPQMKNHEGDIFVFPQDEFLGGTGATFRCGGITLRDLFAVAALAASYDSTRVYKIADECLERRNR